MSNNPNFHTYTDADLAYVKDNHGTKSMADMAEHIGVTVWALKRKLTYWRNSGEDIPKVPTSKPSDIGTVSHWFIEGKTVAVVKTENGWRYLRAPKADKPIREVIVKKSTHPPKKHKKPATGRPQSAAPRKPVKKYADRLHTQKVSFRIDSKTVVMIDADADRDAVIQKYKKAI